MGKKLAVELDGVFLEAEEAEGVWQRFSEFMDTHGDPAAFAKEEGVASVEPRVKDGRACLVVRSK